MGTPAPPSKEAEENPLSKFSFVSQPPKAAEVAEPEKHIWGAPETPPKLE